MKKEIYPIDNPINGRRKTNIGVRVFPEIKNKLTEKAAALGVTLSEYTENILLNYPNLIKEKENLLNEIKGLKEEVYEKDCIIEEYKDASAKLVKEFDHVKAENKVSKIEVVDLTNKINSLNDQIKENNEKFIRQLSETKKQKIQNKIGDEPNYLSDGILSDLF